MPDQQSSVREQLVALEDQWMDAWRRRDREACDRILAEEFLLTSSLGGEVFNKAQWLEGAMGPIECQSFSFDKVDVRVYGDAAVVHSEYAQRATARGQDWSGRFRITDVWVKRDDRWQVVARHSTMLPTAA